MTKAFAYKSWGLALFSVLVLWGINNLLLGVGAKVMQGNAIVYSCTAFTTGSLILLFYAGPGPLVKESMRSLDTWFYGITLLISYSLSFVLYSYVSSTEGTLLQRFSMIISLLIGWFFLSRRPGLGQVIGAVLVVLGICLIILGISSSIRAMVFLLMTIFSLFLAARIFAAEYHKPHIQAIEKFNYDPKARARVVGCVIFVISTMFALLTFSIAFVQSIGDQSLLIKGLPVLSDFFNTGNIVLGLLAGAFILAPMLVIEFNSSHDIKTESYLALTSLAAVSTWFWESVTSSLTGLSLGSFLATDVVACILITIGGICVAILKPDKDDLDKSELGGYLTREMQDLDAVSETRNIVFYALESYANDMAETAFKLGIPVGVIKAVLKDKSRTLAFSPWILKVVEKNYRNNVANVDVLTGLLNRNAFIAELKEASQKFEELTLLFIDLNKFKPINDTYGHDAGDLVLSGTARRLQKLFKNKSVITRWGGDEFCVLVFDVNKEKVAKKLKYINLILEKPFEYNENLISVSSAIGLASFPEDSGCIESLVSIADARMYQNKNKGFNNDR